MAGDNYPRIVSFYHDVFGAEMTFEMAATDDHPRMAILDLGAGSALNIIEQPADTIIGDRSPIRLTRPDRPLRPRRIIQRHPQASTRQARRCQS